MSLTSPLARQMKARDKDMVPRVLVQAMFGLMLATLSILACAGNEPSIRVEGAWSRPTAGPAPAPPPRRAPLP